MKRIIVMLIVASMFSALPAFAQSDENMQPKATVYVEQCVLASETIQDKIAHIKADIAEGKNVYSDAELQKLQDKLKETTDFLNAMGKN